MLTLNVARLRREKQVTTGLEFYSPTTGFPAINVPMGYSRGGTLPVGIKLAYAYEQATHHRRAPVSTPPLR